MNQLLPLALVIATAPVISHSTSFDCDLATSKIEKMICGDYELSALDDELHETYQTAKLVVEDMKSFKKSGMEALKTREEYCQSKRCVKSWYVEREKILNQIIRTGKIPKCIKYGKVSLNGHVIKKQYEIYNSIRGKHTRTSYLLKVNPAKCVVSEPVELDHIPTKYNTELFELVGINNNAVWKTLPKLLSKNVTVVGDHYIGNSQYYFSTNAIGVEKISQIQP